MTPYQRACRNALTVQDACNFSGVLLSFASDMEAVREHLHQIGGYSSHAFATHPVAILYLDKLADLQHRPEQAEYGQAYDALRAIVAEAESEENATA